MLNEELNAEHLAKPIVRWSTGLLNVHVFARPDAAPEALARKEKNDQDYDDKESCAREH